MIPWRQAAWDRSAHCFPVVRVIPRLVSWSSRVLTHRLMHRQPCWRSAATNRRCCSRSIRCSWHRIASVAALLRRVFWRAAASSPAALAETAAAYERLLEHGVDAAAVGRRVSRQDVRRFTGSDDTQLVLWELVAERGVTMLSLGDMTALRGLRQSADRASGFDDARVAALRQLLADGVPSLVFVTRRATVRYLRDRLIGLRTGWCSGTTAGIGTQRLPRATLFEWYRADGPVHPLAPVHLITTDVASEGLDLGRLRRVVHYDLPWTPARLEQREGRSRRGAWATLATAVSMPPEPALEQRLRLAALLDAKRALPGQVGLRAREGAPWRWREALVNELGTGEAGNGRGRGRGRGVGGARRGRDHRGSRRPHRGRGSGVAGNPARRVAAGRTRGRRASPTGEARRGNATPHAN